MMRTLHFFLFFLICLCGVRGDDLHEYIEQSPSLAVSFESIAPVLDKLMQRSPDDNRFPFATHWTLYGQAQTAVSLSYGKDRQIRGASIQFYLGFDKQRERHYDQCLPIARFLILSLMKVHRPEIKEIDQALREIEHTNNIKEFREKDRVMFFRYKMAKTVAEDEDGYRCFRIEIAGPTATPSTDT